MISLHAAASHAFAAADIQKPRRFENTSRTQTSGTMRLPGRGRCSKPKQKAAIGALAVYLRSSRSVVTHQEAAKIQNPASNLPTPIGPFTHQWVRSLRRITITTGRDWMIRTQISASLQICKMPRIFFKK